MLIATMCDCELLVPVTWIMYVPGTAIAFAVTISGDVAAPPDAGVTGEVIDTRTPAGALPIHEEANATVELKPLSG